jgi:hypothetical protein
MLSLAPWMKLVSFFSATLLLPYIIRVMKSEKEILSGCSRHGVLASVGYTNVGWKD